MSGQVPEVVVASRRSGGHWVLYVVLAVVGALLTFAGARAQQKLTDDATFHKLMEDYCAAWSVRSADAPAKFYAQNEGLVFYDVAPFAYHSWKEYHDGVAKEFLDGSDTVKLTLGKDLKVSRHGLIAWTTATIHLYEKAKDGKVTDVDMRYTGIWEKRGAKWVIVHEHLSVPMA